MADSQPTKFSWVVAAAVAVIAATTAAVLVRERSASRGEDEGGAATAARPSVAHERDAATAARPSVTYELGEQVTRDTDTYRHDLFACDGDGAARVSVAHALVTEMDGYDQLVWIQSSRRGAGRELLAQLVAQALASDAELAASPTTHGDARAKDGGGGRQLLVEAGFAPAPELDVRGGGSGRKLWALGVASGETAAARRFLFGQSARADAGKALLGPSPQTRAATRASDPAAYDEAVASARLKL